MDVLEILDKRSEELRKCKIVISLPVIQYKKWLCIVAVLVISICCNHEMMRYKLKTMFGKIYSTNYFHNEDIVKFLIYI